MKIDWSFPRQILLVLLVIGGVSAYPLFKFYSSDVIAAAAAGAGLATLNVLLGFAALEYSRDKSTLTFFKFVLGGMGIRLLFMCGVLVILIKFLAMNLWALICALGLFYVIYLTIEIVYIDKKVSTKQQR
ncbi:MAG: hypothetical protein ACHQQQ_08045 [Bacteroidota bacterium]